MSLERLWLVLAVALPSLGALLVGLPSPDLAYGLRAGAGILDTGAIPSVDTWTFTAAGSPWTDQQWLAQAILAGVFRAAGWTGLVILRAGLVAVVFGCLALAIRRRNPGLGGRTVALVTLAAFAVAAPTLALRPQLVAMVLFAVILVLLVERRAHPRLAWAIPVLAAIWASVHGSFVLAPVACGLAWLEDLHDGAPRRDLALLLAVAAVVAVQVNPFGPGVWAYALDLATNPTLATRVSEWQPTTLRDGQGLLFWGSVAAVVVVLARGPIRAPWPALAWLAVFGVLGATAVRGLAWWPLVAALTAAGLLPAERPSPRMLRISSLNAGLAAAIGVAMLALLPAWRPIDPDLRAPAGVVVHAPGAITTQLRAVARADDRLWAPQVWGSWFEFALPNLPVAVDSRIELFPDAVWRDYDAVATGTAEGLARLDAWDVSIVVVADDEPSLDAGLTASAVWREAFRDADGNAIYLRAERTEG